LSSLFRAWYLFLGLGLLSFVFTALVGQAPSDLSSAVAMPQNLPYRIGVNLRRAIVGIADRRDLQAEVRRLDRQVATLLEENRQLKLSVERLEEVLDIRDAQSPGVVMTAPVIGGNSGPVLDRLTLGKGTKAGVFPLMPATVPQGLVGVVTEVGASTSVVRVVTDPQSRMGVSVRERGGQGIAVGEVGGRIRVINYVERDPVQVGDLVETSSYGGLFPRGILVGEVIEVLPKDANDLRRSFIVQPAVDLSTLLEVALIAPQ